MSEDFDEVVYGFAMLGGGEPNFYRRMPDGKWEDYPPAVVRDSTHEVVHRYSWWNPEGAAAKRIVLALHSTAYPSSYLAGISIQGYAIAHRLGNKP